MFVYQQESFVLPARGGTPSDGNKYKWGGEEGEV